ncbi:hypothetical protein B0A55_05824 [Friedmanniomyces simplex]|uniref:Uncharacterized protein n=1 Tax=Friedmanniomyces simplex TaxID=329884 RepID=A0A4U0X1P3_9PEZI|nr:hypothetical protein B0A55_05824 [Friedmanniomyces simplex]
MPEKWTMVRVEQSDRDPLKVVRLQGEANLPANAVLNPKNQSCLYSPAAFMNPYFELWHQQIHPDQFGMRKYPIFERLTHYGHDETKYAVLQREEESQVCSNGFRSITVCKTSPADLIRQLEKDWGRPAIVGHLRVDMHDVLLASEWDWAMVKDA